MESLLQLEAPITPDPKDDVISDNQIIEGNLIVIEVNHTSKFIVKII